MKRIAILFLLMLIIGVVSAQDDPLASIDTLSAYIDQIASAPAEEAQIMVNDLWAQLLETASIPFVRGEDVAFLYRGDANTVDWRGDFNGWSPSDEARGTRIGETDLWVAYAQFPSDARLDYKIVINGNNWILDPNNPLQQVGGFGPNSELRMPDYVPSPYFVRDENTPQGRLRGPYRLQSEALGYAVNYSVYQPAGYADFDNLPSLYVLDGHEYSSDEMGRMVIILDNLIAQNQISPVLVVFIDPRNVDNANDNLREEQYIENPAFAQFVAEELVLNIDRVFKTAPNADKRAILGTSFGGLASAYIGIQHPDVFANIVIQSPAFWVSSDLYDLYRTSAGIAPRILITNGRPEWDADDIPDFTAILDEKGYSYSYIEVNEGHSWGNWSALLDDILIYFWSMA